MAKEPEEKFMADEREMALYRRQQQFIPESYDARRTFDCLTEWT
jgi:hypothetical protein